MDFLFVSPLKKRQVFFVISVSTNSGITESDDQFYLNSEEKEFKNILSSYKCDKSKGI